MVSRTVDRLFRCLLAPILLASIVQLNVHCAAADTEEDVSVSVLEEEEIEKNPVFTGSELLPVYWPRYDGIVNNEDDLVCIVGNPFSNTAARHVVITLSARRLSFYDDNIANPEDILGRGIFTSDDAESHLNSDGRYTFALVDFIQYNRGEATTQSLAALDPGRYYISAWSVNRLGDILSSSAQFAFWIRN